MLAAVQKFIFYYLKIIIFTFFPFSLVLALKGPAAELLQKVPPDSQNTYAAVSYTHLDVYKRQA